MSTDGTFLVEDFLEAIASQLDRTQDALRLKAVNRPLTYAIRDFSLNLQVFVELDNEGQVRFRSTGPNDTGASTVTIGFTTITRPMIEENTIALSEVQSPSLDDIGLAPQEQRKLAKVGVRNAAQLKKLRDSSGEGAVSKFADIPVNRLRAALQASRPAVSHLAPDSPNGGVQSPDGPEPDATIRVPRGTRRIRLDGRNLRGLADTGTASIHGSVVPIVEADDDHVIVDTGPLQESGMLEIADGSQTMAFELEVHGNPEDPWSPS